MIFKKFHDEYRYTLATIIKHHNKSQLLHEYIVALFNEDRKYKILCNHNNEIISCSCMKFEKIRTLCCLALKAFNLLDINTKTMNHILKMHISENAQDGRIFWPWTGMENFQSNLFTHDNPPQNDPLNSKS